MTTFSQQKLTMRREQIKVLCISDLSFKMIDRQAAETEGVKRGILPGPGFLMESENSGQIISFFYRRNMKKDILKENNHKLSPSFQ